MQLTHKRKSCVSNCLDNKLHYFTTDMDPIMDPEQHPERHAIRLMEQVRRKEAQELHDDILLEIARRVKRLRGRGARASFRKQARLIEQWVQGGNFPEVSGYARSCLDDAVSLRAVYFSYQRVKAPLIHCFYPVGPRYESRFEHIMRYPDWNDTEDHMTFSGYVYGDVDQGTGKPISEQYVRIQLEVMRGDEQPDLELTLSAHNGPDWVAATVDPLQQRILEYRTARPWWSQAMQWDADKESYKFLHVDLRRDDVVTFQVDDGEGTQFISKKGAKVPRNEDLIFPLWDKHYNLAAGRQLQTVVQWVRRSEHLHLWKRMIQGDPQLFRTQYDPPLDLPPHRWKMPKMVRYQ
ncbi:MAG: hypothetical protein ACOCWQ_04885 [Nanoarchaeota archaeon]